MRFKMKNNEMTKMIKVVYYTKPVEVYYEVDPSNNLSVNDFCLNPDQFNPYNRFDEIKHDYFDRDPDVEVFVKEIDPEIVKYQKDFQPEVYYENTPFRLYKESHDDDDFKVKRLPLDEK